MGRRAGALRAWGAANPMVLVVVGYAVAFVVLGLVVASPAEIGSGLGRILFSRDALVTDYVDIGGLGAAVINAGVLTLLACGCYAATGARVTGTSVAALLLVLGTGLFGKSLINVWCVVGGVALYAWFKRESFAARIDVAFFGTALAPIFSELVFSSWLPLGAGIPLGIGVSLIIGFVLVPVAGRLYTAHQGLTLYNMGFVAGVVGLIVVAVCRSFGLVPEPVSTWGTGHRALLAVFLGCLFAATILIGCLADRRRAVGGMGEILTLSGRSPTDFTERVGVSPTLVNIGVCGLIGLAYVLLVGAALNGGVIGALFTVVGFAACGKHPRNIVPVMAGVSWLRWRSRWTRRSRGSSSRRCSARRWRRWPGGSAGRGAWRPARCTCRSCRSWACRSAGSTCTTTDSVPGSWHASSARWPSPSATGCAVTTTRTRCGRNRSGLSRHAAEVVERGGWFVAGVAGAPQRDGHEAGLDEFEAVEEAPDLRGAAVPVGHGAAVGVLLLGLGDAVPASGCELSQIVR